MQRRDRVDLHNMFQWWSVTLVRGHLPGMMVIFDAIDILLENAHSKLLTPKTISDMDELLQCSSSERSMSMNTQYVCSNTSQNGENHTEWDQNASNSSRNCIKCSLEPRNHLEHWWAVIFGWLPVYAHAEHYRTLRPWCIVVNLDLKLVKIRKKTRIIAWFMLWTGQLSVVLAAFWAS